jgi:hypothetical protein
LRRTQLACHGKTKVLTRLYLLKSFQLDGAAEMSVLELAPIGGEKSALHAKRRLAFCWRDSRAWSRWLTAL